MLAFTTTTTPKQSKAALTFQTHLLSHLETSGSAEFISACPSSHRATYSESQIPLASSTQFRKVQKVYSKLYCGYEQVVSQLPLPQGTAEQCQQSRTDTEAEISFVPSYYLSFSTVKQ